MLPEGVFESNRAGARGEERNSGNMKLVADGRNPSNHNVADDAERERGGLRSKIV